MAQGSSCWVLKFCGKRKLLRGLVDEIPGAEGSNESQSAWQGSVHEAKEGNSVGAEEQADN